MLWHLLLGTERCHMWKSIHKSTIENRDEFCKPIELLRFRFPFISRLHVFNIKADLYHKFGHGVDWILLVFFKSILKSFQWVKEDHIEYDDKKKVG